MRKFKYPGGGGRATKKSLAKEYPALENVYGKIPKYTGGGRAERAIDKQRDDMRIMRDYHQAQEKLEGYINQSPEYQGNPDIINNLYKDFEMKYKKRPLSAFKGTWAPKEDEMFINKSKSDEHDRLSTLLEETAHKAFMYTYPDSVYFKRLDDNIDYYKQKKDSINTGQPIGYMLNPDEEDAKRAVAEIKAREYDTNPNVPFSPRDTIDKYYNTLDPVIQDYHDVYQYKDNYMKNLKRFPQGGRAERKARRAPQERTSLGYPNPGGDFREVSIPYIEPDEGVGNNMQAPFLEDASPEEIQSQKENIPELKKAHYDRYSDQMYYKKIPRKNWGVPMHGMMPIFHKFAQLGYSGVKSSIDGFTEDMMPPQWKAMEKMTGVIDNDKAALGVGLGLGTWAWAGQPQLTAKWMDNAMTKNKRGNFHNFQLGDRNPWGSSITGKSFGKKGKGTWARGRRPEDKTAGWMFWNPTLNEKKRMRNLQKAGKNPRNRYRQPLTEQEAQQYIDSNPNTQKYINKNLDSKYHKKYGGAIPKFSKGGSGEVSKGYKNYNADRQINGKPLWVVNTLTSGPEKGKTAYGLNPDLTSKDLLPYDPYTEKGVNYQDLHQDELRALNTRITKPYMAGNRIDSMSAHATSAALYNLGQNNINEVPNTIPDFIYKNKIKPTKTFNIPSPSGEGVNNYNYYPRPTAFDQYPRMGYQNGGTANDTINYPQFHHGGAHGRAEGISQGHKQASGNPYVWGEDPQTNFGINTPNNFNQTSIGQISDPLYEEAVDKLQSKPIPQFVTNEFGQPVPTRPIDHGTVDKAKEHSLFDRYYAVSKRPTTAIKEGTSDPDILKHQATAIDDFAIGMVNPAMYGEIGESVYQSGKNIVTNRGGTSQDWLELGMGVLTAIPAFKWLKLSKAHKIAKGINRDVVPAVKSRIKNTIKYNKMPDVRVKSSYDVSNPFTTVKRANKELEEAVPLIEKTIAEKIARQKTPEGWRRLVAQEREYLKSIGVSPNKLDELSKQAAKSRIDELENIKIMNNPKSHNYTQAHENLGLTKDLIHKNHYFADGAWHQQKVVDDFWNKSAKLEYGTDILKANTKKFEASRYNLGKTRGFGIKSNPGEIGVGIPFTKSVPTINHEAAHALQRGRKLPIDDELRKIKFKSNLTKAEKKTAQYFRRGSKFQEPSAFAHEARESMLLRGIIKNIDDEITPELLLKAQKSFSKSPMGTYDPIRNKLSSSTRILDLADPTKVNLEKLAKEMNKLPLTLAVGTGIGVASKAAPKKAHGGRVSSTESPLEYLPYTWGESQQHSYNLQGAPKYDSQRVIQPSMWASDAAPSIQYPDLSAQVDNTSTPYTHLPNNIDYAREALPGMGNQPIGEPNNAQVHEPKPVDFLQRGVNAWQKLEDKVGSVTTYPSPGEISKRTNPAGYELLYGTNPYAWKIKLATGLYDLQKGLRTGAYDQAMKGATTTAMLGTPLLMNIRRSKSPLITGNVASKVGEKINRIEEHLPRSLRTANALRNLYTNSRYIRTNREKFVEAIKPHKDSKGILGALYKDAKKAIDSGFYSYHPKNLRGDFTDALVTDVAYEVFKGSQKIPGVKSFTKGLVGNMMKLSSSYKRGAGELLNIRNYLPGNKYIGSGLSSGGNKSKSNLINEYLYGTGKGLKPRKAKVMGLEDVNTKDLKHYELEVATKNKDKITWEELQNVLSASEQNVNIRSWEGIQARIDLLKSKVPLKGKQGEFSFNEVPVPQSSAVPYEILKDIGGHLVFPHLNKKGKAMLRIQDYYKFLPTYADKWNQRGALEKYMLKKQADAVKSIGKPFILSKDLKIVKRKKPSRRAMGGRVSFSGRRYEYKPVKDFL